MPFRMDQMFEVIMSVKKGQDNLRQMFESKIDKLRKDILSTIDDKIKAVKVDVDLQFAVLDNRIDMLEQNMSSLTATHVNQTVQNNEVTVIVYNMPDIPEQPLITQAQNLINALGHATMLSHVL